MYTHIVHSYRPTGILYPDQLSTSYSQITILIGSELKTDIHHATGVHRSRSCVCTRHTTLRKIGTMLAHLVGRHPTITAILG